MQSPLQSSRKPLQFRTWHLFLVAILVCGLITTHRFCYGTGGYTIALVEVNNTQQVSPDEVSVGFLMRHGDGFIQSSVHVLGPRASLDYSSLAGQAYEIRYRSRRALWFAKEDKWLVGYLRVKKEIEQCADRQTVQPAWYRQKETPDRERSRALSN